LLLSLIKTVAAFQYCFLLCSALDVGTVLGALLTAASIVCVAQSLAVDVVAIGLK
jgi:hypothetical protein